MCNTKLCPTCHGEGSVVITIHERILRLINTHHSTKNIRPSILYLGANEKRLLKEYLRAQVGDGEDYRIESLKIYLGLEVFFVESPFHLNVA